LLAILAFSLSLLGTFLVRSGVLTSVHTFANDPLRGVFILAILTIFVGGALVLFAFRAPALKPGGLFAPISREGALVLNNLLLTAAAATVLTGTLYPLALEAITGEKISVGAPFFDRTVAPLLLCAVAIMPIGPLLAWKRGDLKGAAERLAVAAALALVVAALALYFVHGGPLLAAVGLLIALYAIAGALIEFTDRIALLREPFAEVRARLAGLPRSAFGVLFAHLGIGVTLLGIVSEVGWSEEKIVALRTGDRVAIAVYDLVFAGLTERDGPNYRELVGRFQVGRGGGTVAVLEPSKRFYESRGQQTTESAIQTFGLGQLYASLGEPEGGSVTARIYWKPLVTLIWLGAVVMAFGGALSLSDRRLRVGAPRRAKRALPVPAE
jgi:cytochrome c-type biogenesis protein CcmF